MIDFINKKYYPNLTFNQMINNIKKQLKYNLFFKELLKIHLINHNSSVELPKEILLKIFYYYTQV